MRHTLIALLCGLSLHSYSQIHLQLRFSASSQQEVTGKFYLFTQSDTSKRIPNNPDPAQAFFVWNITKGQSGIQLNSDNAAQRYLPNGSKLSAGYYKVAGMLDRDFEERGLNNTGNLFSPKESLLYIDNEGRGELSIDLNAAIPERKFREQPLLKEVVYKSELLSDFRRKSIFMKAAVRLPASYYQDSNKIYPVVFVIPGWGGTHFDLQGAMPVKRYGMDQGKEKIYVYLNPETQSPYGLHAFVDSRVNGPWGKAFVKELIPYLQKQYRISPLPEQHFLVGQSTGGYGVLWLQLHYPEAFGGCWAVSPDPVDFSAFMGVDLYAQDANLFTDAAGKDRGTFFVGGKPMLTIRNMVKMESAIGDGEQLQAFEAEFGVPDGKGRPKQLFDHTTGKIDPTTVKAWSAYDLAKYVVKQRKQLAKQVMGKIHVYAGDKDNFLLHEAVSAFGKKALAAGVSVKAELIPNVDHWSIWAPAFTKRIQEEIDAKMQ